MHFYPRIPCPTCPSVFLPQLPLFHSVFLARFLICHSVFLASFLLDILCFLPASSLPSWFQPASSLTFCVSSQLPSFILCFLPASSLSFCASTLASSFSFGASTPASLFSLCVSTSTSSCHSVFLPQLPIVILCFYPSFLIAILFF